MLRDSGDAILEDGIGRARAVGVNSGRRGLTGRCEHPADDEHALVDGPACAGNARRRIEVNIVYVYDV